MYKLAVILITIALATHAYGKVREGIRLGGYSERPDLINNSDVRSFTTESVNHIGLTKNIRLTDIRVISVQTQVVAGTNYKILFEGKSVANGKRFSCESVMFVGLDSTKRISSADCHPLGS